MSELETLPDRGAMYDALCNKDSSFEGVFVAGIRTTGIFCRPSCSARKRKPENVVYFRDARSAIAGGFWHMQCLPAASRAGSHSRMAAAVDG